MDVWCVYTTYCGDGMKQRSFTDAHSMTLRYIISAYNTRLCNVQLSSKVALFSAKYKLSLK
jgi:hypothetical protein